MKYSPGRDASGKPLISPKEAALGCWGMAICVVFLAWTEWVNPTVPPYTGRSAWFYSLSAELLGAKGPSIVWWSFAALLFAGGALGWLGSKRTPR